MKKIAIVGGGNGTAIAIRSLLKNALKYDISALVSVADSGGSSGKLREELTCLPPGDILRAIIAFSKYNENDLWEVFYKNRIRDCRRLNGHNLGNLFLALTWQYTNNVMAGIKALEQAVGAVGHVYPISLNSVDLAVGLEDGTTIRRENLIDRPRAQDLPAVKNVWLEPEAMIYEESKKIISKADYIIIAPGSFVTSILACLAVQGVKKSIKESKAKVIFIADNKYESDGAPIHPQLSYILALLIDYLGKNPDFVIFNDQAPDEKKINYYREKKWGVLVNDCKNNKKYKITFFDFEKEEGGISSEKLGLILKNLLI